MFPPLYDMDDYTACIENNNYYCKIDAVLNIPPHNESLLHYINIVKDNKDLYDRRFLQRLICARTENINNEGITELVNEKIRNYNLTSNITNFVCTDGKYTMTLFDKIILYPVIVYLVFILFATLYDLFNRKNNPKGTLQSFSLHSNLKKRLIIPDYEDFNRMKSMQGFRGFSMIYVISAHLMVSYSFFSKKNPEDYEQLVMWKPIKMITEAGLFILTSFMVMSSWITLMQAHHILEKAGKLTFKHVIIRIINRYSRFVSSIMIVIILSSTLLIPLAGPINFEFFMFCGEVCRKNWIYNLLLINNFQLISDICNPVSWYISADFHLYIANMLLVYIVIKYKLNELKVYIISLILWSAVYGSSLYYYEEGPIFRPNLRNNERTNFEAHKTFLVTHTSTFSNGASSTVGLIMGYLYLNYKKTTLKPTKIATLLWLILFFGLPTLSIYLSFYVKTDRLQAAILGAVVKPLYAFGMGIGMLGMSYNIGGFIKKLFELKIFLILANFSFATYICNFVISLTTYSFTMLNIDPVTIFVDFLRVQIISLALGVFITLAFEEPFNSLQKILVPQTRIGEIQKKK